MAELDQGNAKDTLMGVLTYIDSPFKLAVVILLAVLGFSGYFLYNNQALLIGAYERSSSMPKMDHSRFEDAARLLIKATDADLVAILEVDPILGKRRVIRIFNKDGSREKELDGLQIPLFSKSSKNNADVIKLMAGEVPCSAYDYPQSELGFFYVGKLGPKAYMCRISVPPDPNEFIGQISVGWKTQPEKDPLNYMAIAAEMITQKK
jgi:hypothetical protein